MQYLVVGLKSDFELKQISDTSSDESEVQARVQDATNKTFQPLDKAGSEPRSCNPDATSSKQKSAEQG